MPNGHIVVHAANRRLEPGAINQVTRADIEALGVNASLLDLVRRFRLTRNRASLEFIATWPPAEGAAVVAAVRNALSRPKRMAVTFAWLPGYDYKVTISESAGIPGSAGEMTIVMESRYPGDINNATERMVASVQKASAAAVVAQGGGGAAKKAAKKARRR